MQKKTPNILLLFTDQQRYDTINACGYPHMKTPSLDRLVREGCYFRNAYSPNPVCVPARHNLLTGLPARYHGYTENIVHPLNYCLPTLPRILSDHGIFSDHAYDTQAIGKMHFRPRRRHSGFNRMKLMEEIPSFREEDDYAMYLKEVGLGHIQNIHGVRNLLYMLPQRSLIPEEHHGSTWVGNRSVKYLRNNGGRRPFFLWSSWITPHPPFDVPATFADLYNNVEIPKPLASKTQISPLAAASKRNADFPCGQEKEFLLRIRQLYYSAISLIDKNVGKIIAALEDIGELDNTLIIFTSDHGEMLGDHGCYQKCLPYDGCARIPFIVRYPKLLAAGSVREEFIDLNDIMPTVLDIAGIGYPGPYELPGGSIFGSDKNREHHYMEYYCGQNRWISIRDKRYKFNYYYGGGREELFDLQNDPGETINLLSGVPSAELLQERDRLYKVLCRYEEKWGLEGCAVNERLLELAPRPEPTEIIRNGQFPVFPKNLARTEKLAMNDFGDEVIAAVKDEPLVKLHRLDLDCWRKNGAPESVIARIKREKL